MEQDPVAGSEPAEPFLVFGAPSIGADEIAEVEATLRSGWLGTGPRVARFEQEFSRYKSGRPSVAVSSGTAALHLSMVASGIGPGDEVITTPLTFAATANAILHAGATPVLADVDPATMNLDPEQVAAVVTSRTRAIIPVHFAGRMCDIHAISDIARERDLVLIEDCAHAIEANVQGQSAGTFGDYGCFSFYATKNLTTAEGGMVLARSEEAAERIKCLALQGLSRDAWSRFGDSGYRHYYVVERGFKYNMTDIQAAIGTHQLARIEASLERRESLWKLYDDRLAGFPISLPPPPAPGSRHARHLFTVLTTATTPLERDRLIDEMTARGIGVGVHYLSLPEHPYYQQALGWRPEDYPHACRIGRTTLSLPLAANLTERDIARVVCALGDALGVSAGEVGLEDVEGGGG